MYLISMARRIPFVGGIDHRSFVLIYCRVVLSMGVTVIIEHYMALSHLTTVVLLKVKNYCKIKIVKEFQSQI